MAKRADYNQIKEISAQIEKGVQELFESEKYKQYLTTMSRFHSYSFRNTMLIHMQRPDATMVAGYTAWETSFGRHVNAHEKGIKIFAPAPYMKKVKTQKIDPDTNLPVLDAEGKPVTEEKSVQMPQFKVVYVYDVSQTDGEPIPQLSEQLTGTVENYEIFMEALRRTSPVPMEVKPITESMDGYFDTDAQSISIQEGMSEVQTVSAAIHEISHATLHNYDHSPDSDNAAMVDQRTEEVEAESIAYTVCQFFGIETSENSFGYIAEWSKGKELKELQSSLETINHTAHKLINRINNHYQDICHERGVDLTAEKDTQQEAQAVPSQREISALAYDLDQLFVDYYTFSHLQENPDRAETKQRIMAELSDPSASAYLTELQEIAADTEDACAPRAAALAARLTDYLDRMFPNWKKLENTPLKSAPIEYNFAPPVTEGLFLLDNNRYLHINLEASETWDVSVYDKETFALLGCCTLADNPNMDMVKVMQASFQELGMAYETMESVPGKARAAIYEKIQDSANVNNLRRFLKVFPSQAPTETQESVSHAPTPSPENPTHIDGDGIPSTSSYDNTVPDPLVSMDFMRKYGYKAADMLPMSQDRARELQPYDVSLYMLYSSGTEEMVLDAWDVEHHEALFGISQDDWDSIKDQVPHRDVEQRFLNSSHDAFAIYQLRPDAPKEFAEARFDQLAQPPEHGNYQAVYVRGLNPGDDVQTNLYNIVDIFTGDMPQDFTGHENSVGDIIALKRNGVVSYHYCDYIGFQELPDFAKPENYLKNAEMAMEDDYGMIDGIINNGTKPTVAELEAQAKSGHPISLMDLADAIHRERHERKSVIGQLKSTPTQEHNHKTSRKKHKAKEL